MLSKKKDKIRSADLAVAVVFSLLRHASDLPLELAGGDRTQSLHPALREWRL